MCVSTHTVQLCANCMHSCACMLLHMLGAFVCVHMHMGLCVPVHVCVCVCTHTGICVPDIYISVISFEQ